MLELVPSHWKEKTATMLKLRNVPFPFDGNCIIIDDNEMIDEQDHGNGNT